MRKKLTRKLWAWIRNSNYTTGNLLDFAYFEESYRLTAIDLSKKNKLKYSQQVSFIGKLENQAHGVTMFFIIEDQYKLFCIFTNAMQMFTNASII